MQLMTCSVSGVTFAGFRNTVSIFLEKATGQGQAVFFLKTIILE